MEEDNQALIKKIHEKIDQILSTDTLSEEEKVAILRDALMSFEDK